MSLANIIIDDTSINVYDNMFPVIILCLKYKILKKVKTSINYLFVEFFTFF